MIERASVLAHMAIMAQPVTALSRIGIDDYFSLIDGWQEAHKDEDDIEPPDVEWWHEQQERIENNPHLTGVSSS